VACCTWEGIGYRWECQTLWASAAGSLFHGTLVGMGLSSEVERSDVEAAAARQGVGDGRTLSCSCLFARLQLV